MARSDGNSQGIKRPADGDPDGAQPLTKRFGCLQIGHDAGARARHDTIPPTAQPDDVMLLDDTKHTTYIYNLDQELSEPESSTEGLVLLPLAARMISVPESVLSTPTQSQELVIYTEPASLTVPQEKDSVRKAIIESRARARARARALQSKSAGHTDDTLRSDKLPSSETQEDPMDIDTDT
ncbi:hypothetical protein N7468_001934 [Penicillium chermesinum]|uniref:Uncharacterized protein n=1 Tax=Penicillium chermesinum TaxID=63820 RepID=A0A9W9TX11_9EURO|nr:uncharacterized protein N7468_001934 [Penicillium chermesinum]KAJ5246951.1 hypothetical protein N7468_001934 [Penicillium chermesinum]KAJ6145203.1 hypothetical protein N7470_009098 [Penicillium chermesinum]